MASGSSMTWEQKLEALNVLGECALFMRKPGDWYVNQPLEIKRRGSGVLTSAYGNGVSPEKAVDDHWRLLVTDLPPDWFIVSYTDGTRRQVRWNGFMWEEQARIT